MNRALGLAVSICVASASSQTVAAALSRAQSAKRLLVVCMNREMSASKTISYNEATKLCKAQIKTQSATLTTGLLKPVS